MWDHVTLRATDLDASATFYDTVLRTLGVERSHTAGWLVEYDQFSLSPANEDKPATRGLHIGFTAPTREHVHALWQAGVDAGYRDDGEPGLRPEYGPDYYGGFLLDPDGNSAEAVHHDRGAGGSFSVVSGTPTEKLHMAFLGADRAAVEAFHRTAVGAGYRDNGAPGERPEYHPGYYGAFVLDPDGNNVEVVYHDRR